MWEEGSVGGGKCGRRGMLGSCMLTTMLLVY